MFETIFLTLAGVLGSAGAWTFYQARMKMKRKKNQIISIEMTLREIQQQVKLQLKA